MEPTPSTPPDQQPENVSKPWLQPPPAPQTEERRESERRKDFRRSDIPDALMDRMFDLNEQTLALRRKELNWRNIKFTLIGGFFLITTLWYMVSFQEIRNKLEITGPYAAQVLLAGDIGPGGPIAIDRVEKQLDSAFKDARATCVLLVINSPGGTPVQAGLIHDRVLHLKEKHKKKTIVLARDYMASGGYMIGVAGDQIYADGSSIIGSIGVISASFGFQDVLPKVGIERRVLAAGSSKNGGDPFVKQNAEHTDKMRGILDTMHQQFISKVKTGRGDRLKASDEVLFNADVWTGSRAVELGLIDGLKDAPSVLAEDCGVEQVKDYSKRDFLTTLTQRFGSAVRALQHPNFY